MENKFFNTDKLPYCRGCGHHLIAKNMVLALERMGVSPLDVILVTDIGCHGIIDKTLNVHTVHGLHGRSVALATGISMALTNPDKKVIVFVGDGGVTIGLQHLMEAARLNIDVSVIVHNNFLYGMTGGQASGLTPTGFKTTITPEGTPTRSYDLLKILSAMEVPIVGRIIGKGDFSQEIEEVLSTPGFSLLEVVEICTSYAGKRNPGMKLEELLKREGKQVGFYRNDNHQVFSPQKRDKEISLLEEVEKVSFLQEADLEEKVSFILGGSAGEGVQSAAIFLAQAAIASGLNSSKKGSYPVTVGVGFSNAEVIISPQPILYNGIETPTALLITSLDGLNYNLKRIKDLSSESVVLLDESLGEVETQAQVIRYNFRQVGFRSASIFAVLYYLEKINPVIPPQNLWHILETGKLKGKLPLAKMKELLGK